MGLVVELEAGVRLEVDGDGGVGVEWKRGGGGGIFIYLLCWWRREGGVRGARVEERRREEVKRRMNKSKEHKERIVNMIFFND